MTLPGLLVISGTFLCALGAFLYVIMRVFTMLETQMRADPPIVNVTTAAPEVHLDMDEFKPPDLPSAAQHDVRYLEQFIQDPMDGRLPEVNVDWQPPDGLQAMGIDDESWQPDPMDTETGI